MLEVIAFICGFAIMSVELAGARLLSPYVGASIITWSALIGIIMVSLSAGYYAGGKEADKKTSYFTLSIIILLSGIWLFLLNIFYKPFLLFITENYFTHIYLSSIFSSITLFLVPSFLLAFCSPYIVKLAINERHIEKENFAGTIGKFSAISTLGSIAGTFATGFVFLIYFSLSKIFAALALVLIILGLTIYLKDKRFLKLILPVYTLIFAICCFFLLNNINKNAPNVLKTIESPYQHLEVKELPQGENKLLYLVNNPHLGVYSLVIQKKSSQQMLGYLDYMRCSQFYRPLQKNILVLGCGPGVFVKNFFEEIKNKFPNEKISIDGVEIDKEVVRLGKDFFQFKEKEGMQVFIDDARNYVNKIAKNQSKKYDSIYIDVYKETFNIPFHVISEEAFLKMKLILNDDGIIVINIISALEGPQSKALKSIYKTINKHFTEINILKTSSTSNKDLQNIILIASNKSLETGLHYPQIRSIIYTGLLEMNGITAIKDEYSPLEKYYLETQKN